jgi:hypothetical protein
MRFSSKITLICLALCSISIFCFAQDNYEIQVYPSELVAPDATMVELHSNYTARGSTLLLDAVRPTQGGFHETVEITHGFTPWLEIGFYVFNSISPGYGYNWVGDHIRPRISVPESMNLPVGLSLSAEIGYQRREYDQNTFSMELRPIIDKKIGNWYFSLNPTVDYSFVGSDANRGGIFSPNFKFSYDVNKKVALGIEYYGSLGPFSGFDPPALQQHQIVPSIDLNLSPDWEFNFGVAFGVTKSTDPLIFKMILGRRLAKKQAN